MERAQVRLLLVDDEAKYVSALARRLGLRGFEVVTAGSGIEALALAGAQRFDVAIVDLKMPGMQGEELIQAFGYEHPELEVIVLTAHASVSSAIECVRAGSRHYLRKPCETPKLLAVIREALEFRDKRCLIREELRLERLRAALPWKGAVEDRE